MALQHTVKAVVRKGDKLYIAECVEIAVMTQGRTLDETLTNLQEAVALHLQGEEASEFGFIGNPTILVTMELEPTGAKA
jgi:predicted RNase H-like HicB family nuclease